MKIGLFLDFPLYSTGGIQQSVLLQKKYLEQTGHTVIVIAGAPHDPKVSGHADVEVDSKQLPGGEPEHRYYWPSKKVYSYVEQQLKAHSLDVVHIQGIYWGGIIGMRYAYRHNLPVVETIHDNYYYALKHIILRPWLYDHLLRYYILRATGRTARDYLRARIQAADAIIVPSEYFRDQLQTAHYAHVSVVGNGVDDDIVCQIVCKPKPQPSRLAPPRIVWAGRITREKRVMEAVEAAIAARVSMAIYGNGPLEAALRERLARPDAKNITFHGRVSYAELLEQMRQADYFFLSSYHFETQGMVVYEALAAGTPVLLADERIASYLPESLRLVSKSPSVEDMTAMLVATHTTKLTVNPQEADTFLQSYKTEQLVAIYNAVVKKKRRR